MTDPATDGAEIDNTGRKTESATAQPGSSHGYRWLAALLLFLLIGGGIYSWFQSDQGPGYDAISRNRAYAEIRILRERPPTLHDLKPQQSEVEFQAFRATMARQVKSDFVLATSLRKPGIAELQLFQQVDHPLEYLKEQLEVDFPAEEFMRISLNTPNSKQAVAIVNAVYESFLRSLVEAKQQERRSRRKKLEDIRKSLEDKLRAKQTAHDRLSEALETGNKETQSLRQQLELENLAQLRKHHAEIQSELMQARIQLATQEASGEPNDSDPDRQETSAEQKPQPVPPTQQSLQKKVKLLEIAAKRLEEEMDSHENLSKRRLIPSFELETLKKQIQQMQVEVDQVSQEIQRMDIDFDIGIPRVSGYREATFRPEE